jgi:hypothetical protein
VKAIVVNAVRATAAAVIAIALSWLLRRPAEYCAVLIRRQWPEAWFSGLIVWYADFAAIAISVVIAVVIVQYACNRQGNSN